MDTLFNYFSSLRRLEIHFPTQTILNVKKVPFSRASNTSYCVVNFGRFKLLIISFTMWRILFIVNSIVLKFLKFWSWVTTRQLQMWLKLSYIGVNSKISTYFEICCEEVFYYYSHFAWKRDQDYNTRKIDRFRYMSLNEFPSNQNLKH